MQLIFPLMRMKRKITQEFNEIPTTNGHQPLRIYLVGESYCVIEPFVNFDIIEYLGTHRCFVEPFLTAHRWLFAHALRIDENRNLPRQKAKALARPIWEYNVGGEDQLSIGHSVNAARTGFDGIIHLMPFSCMPETAALPVFEKVSRLYNIPLLNISLDEHTSPTGITTRIEAFIDLLMQRRSKKMKAPGGN